MPILQFDGFALNVGDNPTHNDQWKNPVILEHSERCPFCDAPVVLKEAKVSFVQHYLGCYNEACWFQPGASDWNLDELILQWNTRP